GAAVLTTDAAPRAELAAGKLAAAAQTATESAATCAAADAGTGLRAQPAKHAGDFSSRRILNRDDDRLDIDRQRHIHERENLHHAFHVLRVIAQHEHRTALYANGIAGQLRVRLKNADGVFG